MRILIADDQRSFGTALADMVRWCGHEVVAVVGSGLEAIHGFTQHKPDLVLMDHRMPKLNGATACRHILAKDPTARIILVSAWSPLDGADDSGAMSFLPKPVDMDRLSIALQNVEKTIAPSSNLPTPSSDLPAPNFDLPPANFDFIPANFIPIPQEIISPIETFPAQTFPIETGTVVTDMAVTIDPVPASAVPFAKGKKPRKAQRATRSRRPRAK